MYFFGSLMSSTINNNQNISTYLVRQWQKRWTSTSTFHATFSVFTTITLMQALLEVRELSAVSPGLHQQMELYNSEHLFGALVSTFSLDLGNTQQSLWDCHMWLRTRTLSWFKNLRISFLLIYDEEKQSKHLQEAGKRIVARSVD